MPHTPVNLKLTILIFGNNVGYYVKLCHSYPMQLYISYSLSSINRVLDTFLYSIYHSKKTIDDHLSACSVPSPKIYVQSVVLSHHHQLSMSILLSTGRRLSYLLYVEDSLLQILPHDNTYALFKQLNSLSMHAASSVRDIDGKIEHGYIFSWIVSCSNITEHLHRIYRRDLQSNIERTSQMNLSTWHLTSGYIVRNKHDIVDVFFGSISALVGTPVESSSQIYHLSTSNIVTLTATSFSSNLATSAYELTTQRTQTTNIASTTILQTLLVNETSSRKILSTYTDNYTSVASRFNHTFMTMGMLSTSAVIHIISSNAITTSPTSILSTTVFHNMDSSVVSISTNYETMMNVPATKSTNVLQTTTANHSTSMLLTSAIYQTPSTKLETTILENHTSFIKVMSSPLPHLNTTKIISTPVYNITTSKVLSTFVANLTSSAVASHQTATTIPTNSTKIISTPVYNITTSKVLSTFVANLTSSAVASHQTATTIPTNSTKIISTPVYNLTTSKVLSTFVANLTSSAVASHQTATTIPTNSTKIISTPVYNLTTSKVLSTFAANLTSSAVASHQTATTIPTNSTKIISTPVYNITTSKVLSTFVANLTSSAVASHQTATTIPTNSTKIISTPVYNLTTSKVLSTFVANLTSSAVASHQTATTIPTNSTKIISTPVYNLTTLKVLPTSIVNLTVKILTNLTKVIPTSSINLTTLKMMSTSVVNLTISAKVMPLSSGYQATEIFAANSTKGIPTSAINYSRSFSSHTLSTESITISGVNLSAITRTLVPNSTTVVILISATNLTTVTHSTNIYVSASRNSSVPFLSIKHITSTFVIPRTSFVSMSENWIPSPTAITSSILTSSSFSSIPQTIIFSISSVRNITLSNHSKMLNTTSGLSAQAETSHTTAIQTIVSSRIDMTPRISSYFFTNETIINSLRISSITSKVNVSWTMLSNFPITASYINQSKYRPTFITQSVYMNKSRYNSIVLNGTSKMFISSSIVFVNFTAQSNKTKTTLLPISSPAIKTKPLASSFYSSMLRNITTSMTHSSLSSTNRTLLVSSTLNLSFIRSFSTKTHSLYTNGGSAVKMTVIVNSSESQAKFSITPLTTTLSSYRFIVNISKSKEWMDTLLKLNTFRNSVTLSSQRKPISINIQSSIDTTSHISRVLSTRSSTNSSQSSIYLKTSEISNLTFSSMFTHTLISTFLVYTDIFTSFSTKILTSTRKISPIPTSSLASLNSSIKTTTTSLTVSSPSATSSISSFSTATSITSKKLIIKSSKETSKITSLAKTHYPSFIAESTRRSSVTITTIYSSAIISTSAASLPSPSVKTSVHSFIYTSHIPVSKSSLYRKVAISSSFLPYSSSIYSLTSSAIATTAKPDNPPQLLTPIGHIYAETGRRFYYQIPDNIFFDPEDGDTRNLTLECLTTSGESLASNSWLMFNPTSRILSGIPLINDFTKQASKALVLKLIAYDKSKNFAIDTFSLLIMKPLSSLTFTLSLTLAINYDDFHAQKNLRQALIERISQFYGDSSSSFIYLSSVVNGSTIVSWSNTSSGILTCNKQEIDQIVQTVQVQKTNTPSKAFLKFLLPEFPVLGLSSSYEGVCVITVATKVPVSVARSSNKMSYIIPIVVFVVLILLVLIIVLFLYRRKRRRNRFFTQGKIYEKGRPILLPDEVELKELPEKIRIFENLAGTYIGPLDDDEVDGQSSLSSSTNGSHSSFSSLEYIPPLEPPPPYMAPPPYMPFFKHR